MTGGGKIPDLAPCPFCGSAAELERDEDHHGAWFNLGCSNHWGRRADAEGGCPGGRIFYTEAMEDEPAAIAAWNTRADLAHPAELAELAELMRAGDESANAPNGLARAQACGRAHKALDAYITARAKEGKTNGPA